MSVTARDLAHIHRVSVDEYQRMGETGILGHELRTELIEGEIVEMPPIGHTHAGTVTFLIARLTAAVGERAMVTAQNPVTLSPFSEPQPDLALLRPRADFYRNANPGPEGVLLVIEVADSSLRYDRELKLPLYARSGIPEAWLVDLAGRALTRYRDPGQEGYREQEFVADLSRLPLPLDLATTLDLSELF